MRLSLQNGGQVYTMLEMREILLDRGHKKEFPRWGTGQGINGRQERKFLRLRTGKEISMTAERTENLQDGEGDQICRNVGQEKNSLYNGQDRECVEWWMDRKVKSYKANWTRIFQNGEEDRELVGWRTGKEFLRWRIVDNVDNFNDFNACMMCTNIQHTKTG